MAATLIGLVAYFLYRYRVARLIELERVRTRIATDLHDDIGSSLSQVSVLSEVVRRRVGSEPSVSEPLSMIADLSRDLVDSMNDIVWAINPRRDHLSDLTHRIRRFASDVFTARDIEFNFSAPEAQHDIRLGADMRREVFLIFKESVNNMVRHSGCTEANIEFLIESGWLELKIRDNGKGFEPDREGDGNGLVSMRQRTARIGGTLDISSNHGKGTVVRLRAPLGRRAWRKRADRPPGSTT
jgi:signal transduction histidine kinase